MGEGIDLYSYPDVDYDEDQEYNTLENGTFDEDYENEYDEKITVRNIPNVTCEIETKKAIMVRINGLASWIPKSVIHPKSEVKNNTSRCGPGTLIITQWFANKKRL